jgi:site-specific recombinase XerC
MIDLYLDHLRVERRLADRTLERYARELARLAAFAAQRKRTPESLDRRALEVFARPHKTASVAIRGFYAFLVLDRRIDANPLG